MKPRFFLIISLLLLSLSSLRAQLPERYFPYPEIPAEYVTLQERTAYLVDHFWERCDFNTAFSAKAKMAQAFDDYVQFLRHAPRENSLASINNLLTRLEKNPDGLLFITQLAENHMYSDSADLASDETYLPFVKAVAANKRISKADKQKYALQADILSANAPGNVAPSLDYVTPSGQKCNLDNDTAKIVVVFFNDPDNLDCRLARARINSNAVANDLIEAGVMKIVAITPGDPTDLWRSQTEAYPKNWTVGAAPSAFDKYDIRNIPSFYIIDDQHRIAAKNVSTEALINFFKTF